MVDAVIEKEAPTTAPRNPNVGMTDMGAGINQNLLAVITCIEEVFNDGKPSYKSMETEQGVYAFLEDGEFSLDNQYSAPFEDSNPEGRMPNLMALVQSGQGLTAAFDILEKFGIPKATLEGSDLAKTVEGLKGKTSFTKINSQQIFTSSSGVKISGTLVFSAWADAKTEVEDAIQKLQEWATPVYLSDKSLVQNMSEKISLDSVFSSVVPPLVQLKYGGKTYLPLVIENLSAPITAPMNANGDRITVKCQISLLSLKAWDKNNIIALYNR